MSPVLRTAHSPYTCGQPRTAATMPAAPAPQTRAALEQAEHWLACDLPAIAASVLYTAEHDVLAFNHFARNHLTRALADAARALQSDDPGALGAGREQLARLRALLNETIGAEMSGAELADAMNTALAAANPPARAAA